MARFVDRRFRRDVKYKTPRKIRMILGARVVKGRFIIRIREGVNHRIKPRGSTFYRMGLPWRDEEYPDLSVYWKIRLLHSKIEHRRLE